MNDSDRDRDGGDGEAGGGAADRRVDALVADELGRRGELVPTTVGEVLAAEREGVEYEGELPASLRELSGAAASPPPRTGAASLRVVSLDGVRRERAQARAKAGWGGYAVAFVMGAAAAAAVLIATRPVGTPMAPDDSRAAGTPSAIPSAPSDPLESVIAIPAVSVCGTSCCAGSACADAKGELRKCASGRSCVDCEEGTGAGSAFRVRLGNLIPAQGVDPANVARWDLCARVGGGTWTCEPATVDASMRPRGRVLPGAASTADLATAIELEVRPLGGKQVLGRWRDSLRVGPTVLCRGVGALLANESGGVKTDVGSLSIDLEATHWVELGRGADAGALRVARGKLAFADVVPVLVELGAPGEAGGGPRFALAVGPLDAAVAERLRWALLENGHIASVVLGGDYRGEPQRLPEVTPPPR